MYAEDATTRTSTTTTAAESILLSPPPSRRSLLFADPNRRREEAVVAEARAEVRREDGGLDRQHQRYVHDEEVVEREALKKQSGTILDRATKGRKKKRGGKKEAS